MASTTSTESTSKIVNSVEGELVWEAPNAGKECRTFYKVYGDLKSGVRPLVCVHGGPGVSSHYLDVLSDITLERSIPIVLYDQIGNGRSTHFQEKGGDLSFWKEELFLEELKCLLVHLGIYDDYDLLGHAWGGMLASRHSVRHPGGLKRLIIWSSASSSALWLEAQAVLRKKLPQDVQDVIDRCEREGTTATKEFQEAVAVFYGRHLCTLDPVPAAMQESIRYMKTNPIIYHTLNGPTEFTMVGPNKDFSMLDEAHKISVPTLLMNGWHDQAADSCMYPYFKLIPRVRWVQFANSSQVAHLEEREKFMEIVGLFLTEDI
ncbi:hypothetical protein AGABI1DRAFT_109842 [Agaricus bisporus var. burnettii JB137-S8]|uniref:AB hydrolase-1 domain-containing protein n=1 Tax=Agaricus bisporus var. burnettii (strain JB137-S8 / ATCC MYA-4627 / FGSC 10392) TaxID=597362 RepID=K5XJT9_AGABU|nr:uncharacterized protein AGABI1DRAFT_109842 [Agaricus bisporus var. burnettii JB137-S8]EKM74770.1 hypothetical protein AGABI1DRAFT_109842 [Agaricus bisporus var. burnettii JB137-S8]